MAEFVWEARARTGELRKGSMDADDEEAVNTRLRSQQLTPTKVKKKAKGFTFSFRLRRQREGSGSPSRGSSPR